MCTYEKSHCSSLKVGFYFLHIENSLETEKVLKNNFPPSYVGTKKTKKPKGKFK